MDSGLFEIVLLAMIAAVILFRLYTILGRRTGHEPPPQDSFRLSPPGEVPAVGDKTLPAPARPALIATSSDPLSHALQEIHAADRTFNIDEFLAGARHAYEEIVTAFASGNRVVLKPLLSKEVYAAFDSVIAAREENKQKVAFTFVGFKDVKAIHAAMKGRVADITVLFTSQSVSATHDATDAVIDGDPKSVREVTDIWSFERDTRSNDPNWTLVATSGAEA
jgi:predicted lipid-binding transport protein (Tim44 family)